MKKLRLPRFLTHKSGDVDWSATIALVSAVAIWGFTYVVVKKAVDQSAVLPFVALRFWIATTAFIPLVYWERKRLAVYRDASPGPSIAHGFAAGVALFLAYATQTYGIKLTTATTAAFLTCLFVVFVPLIQLIRRLSRPTWSETLGVLLAIVGVAIFSNGPTTHLNLGTLLLVLCAFFYALQITVVGVSASDKQPITFTAMQIATVAVLTTICALWLNDPFSWNGWVIAAAVGTGLLATTFAFLIQTSVQRYISPTHSAVIFTLEPVFATLASAVVLKETLTLDMIIGGMLIVVAVLNCNLARAAEPASAETPTPNEGEIPLGTLELAEIRALNAAANGDARPDPATVKTLILKGGGVKGLAFAGAVDVLTANGYRFKTFVGTSAGAIGATFLAAGFTPAELRNVLKKTPFRNFLSAWPFTMLNFAWSGGLHHGEKLRDWVEEHLAQKVPDKALITLEDVHARAKNRVIIFASHSKLGTLRFDSAGKKSDRRAAHAVQLSASIPGFFVPGEEDGYRIYDGGLLNNFPIDAYLRVQQKDGVPEADRNDFIAMFIGKIDSKQKSTWWGKEVFNILLDRDDAITVEEHKERILTIDTSPIHTTDFDLSEKEKQLLVETGRLAAYNYLGATRRTAETCQRIEELRQEVKGIRRRRAWRYFSFAAFNLACLAGVLTWCFLWYANRAVPQYEPIDLPRYENHYIQNEGKVDSLEELPCKDMFATLGEYRGDYDRDCFQFDSVFQIIISNRTTATKIVLSEGIYNGSQSIIKATTTQDAEGKANPEGYPFYYDDQRWVHGKDWKWRSGNDTERSTSVVCELKEQYLESGQPFKLLGFSAYKDVFVLKRPDQGTEPVGAIAWILPAHRLLSPRGEATYWLIGEPREGDSADEVDFPEHSYISDKGSALIRLSQPSSQNHKARGWVRAKAALDFLKLPDVKQAVGKEKEGMLQHAISTMEIALGNYQKKKTSKGYLFTFDRAETKQLEGSGNVNLVIFAQDMTWWK